MAGQFRFRLPWLSAAAPAPRPAAEPRPPPPKTEIEAPPRPTSTIPILRPPFRPTEMAPVQPPPPAQSPPRTEAQSAFPPLATQRQAVSPSRATTQRRAVSVPPSSFRATTDPQITQPASASPVATQARPALQTQSPSRTAPPSKAASVPPSPSRTTSQPQLAAQTPSQHPGRTSFQPSPPAKLGAQVQQPSQIEETKPKQEEEITSQTGRKYQTEPASENVTVATMLEAGKIVEEKGGNRVTGEIKREGILSDKERRPQKDDTFENGKTMIGSNGEQMKTSRGRYAPSESHEMPTMSNGEKVPLHKEIRENISKFVNKLGTGLPKQDIGGKPASLLTLAGENKGAFLHLGAESARKDGSGYIHRGHKSNPDDTLESTSKEARSSKGGKPKYPAMAEEPLTEAYINSNTQGVNNSILFDSLVTEGSPGVQQSLSYNLAEPTKQRAKPGPLEAHKAEFNIALPEKHTYEPSVKRQCLSGLLIEPSDSDPDNPEKSLRHGSRYRSGEMIEDRDIVIL